MCTIFDTNFILTKKNQTSQNVFLISVTMRCQEVSTIMKNINLGPHYLWNTFFDNFNFQITLFTKIHSFLKQCFSFSWCQLWMVWWKDLVFIKWSSRKHCFKNKWTLKWRPIFGDTVLCVTDIKKPFCNVWLFGKNEHCAKCGTHKCHNPNLVTIRLLHPVFMLRRCWAK